MRFYGFGSASEPGSSRSRLIVGLLVLVLVLVVWLAWQAAQTMQSNRETANLVLRDYARLVADEYARRTMGEVGFYGYYSGINALRPLSGDDEGFLGLQLWRNGDNDDARWGQLVEFLLLVDTDKDLVRVSGGQNPDADIDQYLRKRATVLAGMPATEPGLVIDHVTLGDRSHTFVLSGAAESNRVFGFKVSRSGLSKWLQQAFEQNPLLPESLAGGAVTNDFVYLRFDDENGQMLFESRPDHDPYLLIQKSIDDAYEGIFESHTISTAIDPAIAGQLVIGGLPQSRLPLLLAAILVTIGLLVAAILQLRREHTLMKLRTDFVSEVSHELRTPLTQIRMFAETLLLERFRSEEKKRRALEIIDRESQRLIHLVENVLRFSDRPGDRRKLKLVDAPLAPLIDRVVMEFRPLADGANATLETMLDPDARSFVDSDALRQILLNLLDNAIKYGPPGQRVQIGLAVVDDRVEISVTDQGPGIPGADREKIWHGYQRLDRERKSAIAGTGIGLAVVRDLVERHGGKSRVEDSTDGGARFVIDFPPPITNPGGLR